MRGLKNLWALWEQRDELDEREGKLAYERYNTVMHWFSTFYGFPIQEVCSAFVALSPNSDYHGNLRSLSSVLHGKLRGVPLERITVSTYNRCRDRAYSYLDGKVDFLTAVKGPKIRAFRDNILRPDRSPLVTVDGHMALAWAGQSGTMKDGANIVSSKSAYREISADIVELAVSQDLLPCQAQAILWLTRKRVFAVKYDPQLSFFRAADDAHRTLCRPQDYPPYPVKEVQDATV